MDSSKLAAKARGLGDLELAMLLSLMAKEHCILYADGDAAPVVQRDIQLVSDGNA